MITVELDVPPETYAILVNMAVLMDVTVDEVVERLINKLPEPDGRKLGQPDYSDFLAHCEKQVREKMDRHS